MVFQIECSDEKGEHVELRTDGTVRLFGRNEWDEGNGCFTVTERQLGILRVMLEAQTKMREALR